jgi:ABC-type nitrate/sulfonate/bicarbonate transport system permease component
MVRRANVAGWAVVAAAAAVVEVVVRLFALQDSVAAPSAAIAALARGLWSGALSGAVGTTLESYVEGLALAIGTGVVLGVLVGSSRTLLDASTAVIELLRPIPAVALIPLAIMVFGLGVPMRRFVVAYAALWPVLINTLYGVRSGDRMYHDVAKTSGISPLRRLGRVTVPAALPNIATGIRVSASIALLAGVTAEFVTGTDGLGAYMQRQQLAYHLPELYAAVFLTAFLGYAINIVLRLAQRRLVFWIGEERLAVR